MNYLQAVNRVLRAEGVISGDDDELTDFNGTQHSATLNMAKIAIETELALIAARDYLPYEQADTTLTMIGSATPSTTTRVYALASDFVRFDGLPHFLEVDSNGNSQNRVVTQYPGGERQLRLDIFDYREQTGEPNWFYFVGGTQKQVGFFPVPDANANGQIYRYYYEKDVSVSVETDTLPFVATQEANLFCQLCARRFKYLFATPEVRETLFPNGVERDSEMEANRSALFDLLAGENPTMQYGRRIEG